MVLCILGLKYVLLKKSTVLLTSHTVLLLQSIPVLNGLNKSIALVQNRKNEAFRKFLLISR